MKKKILLLILALSLIGASRTMAEKISTLGMGIFLGGEANKFAFGPNSEKYDWTLRALNLNLVKQISDRFSLYADGSLALCQFEQSNSSLAIGASIIARYNLWKFNLFKHQAKFFLELGPGLGWWNKSPSDDLLHAGSIIGLINYGGGIDIALKDSWSLKVAYRGRHDSAISEKDMGINSAGIIITLEKHFDLDLKKWLRKAKR